MPANVKWHSFEEGIIHMIVEGKWVIDEWMTAVQQASDLANEVAKPVCLILEYRVEADYQAPGLLINLHRAINSPVAHNKFVVQVFVFGERGFQKNVRNIFLRIYQIKKVQYVENWEAALKAAKSCLAHN